MSFGKHHPCPICAKSVPHWEQYPRSVCEDCYDKACDSYGRKLSFYNVSIDSSFEAVVTDTQEAYQSHTCYIDGVECWADEDGYGGIVVEVLN
jgi:hypothetical protein